MVEGIAEATQNIVQGFSGWLSDKLQKRKALALIGYFVSALGKPLMGIARHGRAYWAVAFWTASGLVFAPLSAMPSLHLLSQMNTEGEPLASRALATILGLSEGRYWPFCFSFRSISRSDGSFFSQSFPVRLRSS